MASFRRSGVLSSLICAAALQLAVRALALIAAPGCGSSIDVDSSTSPPAGGSDAGPDAPAQDPPDPPPDPTDPPPDAGPDSGPSGPECDCPSSPGFILSGDLGPLTLTAPYIENSDLLFCSPSLAYAWGYHCSWNFDMVILNACAEKNTAPCIRIGWKKLDEPNATPTVEGKVIDATGETWTLSDIALSGDLPWNGPAATGTFTATGTGEKGNKSIVIQGSFDLCVAESVACPN
jgi:hypothetical protein